jgi:triacylglycerol lipase
VLASLSARRRLFVAGAAAAVIAIGVVVAVAALRPEPLDDSFVPVLLVHGYGGDTDSMRALQTALRDAGRRVESVALPQRGLGDLVVSARAVEAAVDQTGAAKIDFVGYSAGGIIVRSYLEQLGGVERARRVVLIGAPNHGAQIAAVATAADPEGCVDACAQLAPGSSFLAELNEGDETPSGPQFVSIWTAQDRVVTPPDSAALDGALNVRLQDVCSDAVLEHGELVRYPLPVAIVLRALGPSGLSSRPSRTECEDLRARGEAALSS